VFIGKVNTASLLTETFSWLDMSEPSTHFGKYLALFGILFSWYTAPEPVDTMCRISDRFNERRVVQTWPRGSRRTRAPLFSVVGEYVLFVFSISFSFYLFWVLFLFFYFLFMDSFSIFLFSSCFSFYLYFISTIIFLFHFLFLSFFLLSFYSIYFIFSCLSFIYFCLHFNFYIFFPFYNFSFH
jgi:hypothetical protein